MSSRVFVGVDLGGTTITAGCVRGSEILSAVTAPTERNRAPGAIFSTLADLIGEAASGYEAAGIGVGVPVPAGPGTAALEPSGNLPTMGGFPLRQRLEERFGVPVVLENDARAMAYGEYRAGALAGCELCACITLGTGLGCGMIVNGRLLRGAQSRAGEIWNIRTGDGANIEDTVSAAGLGALARNAYGSGVSPSELWDRYGDGDGRAVDVFARYGKAVGRVIALVVSFIDPERVAVGGGIATSYDAFRAAMIDEVQAACGGTAAGTIVKARLSEKAAVIGAAALAGERENRNDA